jgi:gas vesicle protein
MGLENNGNGIGFGLGLAAGLVLGVGVGLLMAPKEGAALRRDIVDRARRLREEAEGFGRDMGRSAKGMAEHGSEFASRVRTAASEGLREARRHMEHAEESV